MGWIIGAVVLAAVGMMAILWTLGKKRHRDAVQEMAQQEPQFDLFFNSLTFDDLGVIPDGKLSKVATTLQSLGFEQWQAYMMPDMHVLVEVATGPKGAVAVHTHPLFGTWFDMWAVTPQEAYIWSNSPLYSSKNTTHPSYHIEHHRLMTVHMAWEGVNNVDFQSVLTPKRLIAEMNNMHEKNIGQFVLNSQSTLDLHVVRQWLWTFVPNHIDRQAEIIIGSTPNQENGALFHSDHPLAFSVRRVDEIQ